jgi:Rad52/22 family double-strand break repair protein
MQPVNGVDHAQSERLAVPQVAEEFDAIQLPNDLKARLKEPLPREAVSPNPQKPGLSAIKVIYVVERLNDVFGLNGWHVDNEVVESGQMVVVKATLSIPRYAIVVEQFGGNDHPDRGDAYKGGCTDALSKCASYLGIAMDVYKGIYDHPQDSGSGRPNGAGAGNTNRWNGSATRNRAQSGSAAVASLTSRNMAARFSSMRSVLGVREYGEILGRHGFREAAGIRNLDKARVVYQDLIEAFRARFGKAKNALGGVEYVKILRELRLNPKARLNPEQAVRVFNRMAETINARQ